MIGLNKFISDISLFRKDIDNKLLKEIKSFIIDSGCKSISFNRISNRIMGISLPEKCTINYLLLSLPIEYFIYILLHEISHQWQYKKYGKNVTKEIYLENINIDDAIDHLMYLEKTADRLAIKKMNMISKSLDLKLNKVEPRYLNSTNRDYFKNHISSLRTIIKLNNCSNIEEINKIIYNNIKL